MVSWFSSRQMFSQGLPVWNKPRFQCWKTRRQNSWCVNSHWTQRWHRNSTQHGCLPLSATRRRLHIPIHQRHCSHLTLLPFLNISSLVVDTDSFVSSITKSMLSSWRLASTAAGAVTSFMLGGVLALSPIKWSGSARMESSEQVIPLDECKPNRN